MAFYNLQGKISWAQHLFQPDIKFEPAAWSCKLHLNPESYSLFMQLKAKEGSTHGLQNVVKTDDDGPFVTLRRLTEKNFRTGRKKAFAPPVVTDRDGQQWDPRVKIGNGSDATCSIEVYNYNKPFTKGEMGTAMRLTSVRIDNPLEFISDRDFSPTEKKKISYLNKTEPQPEYEE